MGKSRKKIDAIMVLDSHLKNERALQMESPYL
jgi:hypothetical protein